MSDWYKVTFHGKPADGKDPILPASNSELLALGGALAELFGFYWIDNVVVTAVEESGA